MLVGLARAGGALSRRPGLWPVCVRQIRRLVPAGWWRRAPFLPLPRVAYLRFRLVTAYGGTGSASAGTDPADVVSYLEWCRAWPRVAGAAHHRM